MQEKFFWAKNGEKGVKNMRFRARLGKHSIDFSDFWYKTSLIYGKDSFARKHFWGQKWCEIGVKNMHLRLLSRLIC